MKASCAKLVARARSLFRVLQQSEERKMGETEDFVSDVFESTEMGALEGNVAYHKHMSEVVRSMVVYSKQYANDAVENMKVKLTKTETELAQNKAKLMTTETELAQNKAKLMTTETELAQNKAKLTKTETELTQNKAKLMKTETELVRAQSQLTQNKIELDENEAKRLKLLECIETD